MIEAWEEGTPFQITGTSWPTRDGSGIRDYIHVWDLATAHVAALERFGTFTEDVINLGTGRGTTVRELVDAFNEVAERPIEVVETGPRPGDVAGAYTRTELARRLLEWEPRHTVAEGIRHSLEWARIRPEILG
jgi:UDP-glucose 4-epimerase